ncbi:crotonase/enoyl-CoA hydratase family protein [Frankia sp. CNm7]|uniref:Crotonase/enoyl-CoA hydratase family protein n=1 Tax=Frankia nepalensis TaxID=1836974 RepID=A0A937UPN1_9ACTN|nr:crotonase/enoyl-CoA hydratase family protein [Frankia nepalensis]MBL7496681.1 crotonase/enoyl-CoA hydratase family protein [Frankia nepalensis]MBL7510677.1 crotonase/enoyl-CoA hydratase family protein [Frankia nepalensis]MBL7516690.1 crotonase/enoyl-CoA hydratase family protein [Frankia nepalensis]MBL7627420.1 crotonase/enoyl-CoA hydratase family protein [Frankia nepalensis]
MTAFEHIRLETVDGIATITLSRPEALNSFTDTMEGELIAAYDLVDSDDSVRAVVLTGAGRAFCAGMDLGDGGAAFDVWSASGSGPEGARPRDDALRRDGGGRVALRMYEARKPIIAAINGPAVGVGITMTLAADFRLAVPAAKIGFVFARRGLVPESCSSWFLPRLVGMQTALDWMYSGRIFTSEEALAAGLLRGIHEPADLLPAARVLADSLTRESAPVSVALTRQLLWRMLGETHPMRAHEAETLAINVRGVSADAREGISAFLDKRPAAFPQRVSTDTPDLSAQLPAPAYQPPRAPRRAG